MPQHQQPVEMILLRQLASYLTVPIWLMDEAGNLLYYNESAEGLLGIRFDDMGPVHADQVGGMFRLTDFDGNPLEGLDHPIGVTLAKRIPSHRELRYCGFDGIWRNVAVSSIPIEGQARRFLGLFATFWEIDV